MVRFEYACFGGLLLSLVAPACGTSTDGIGASADAGAGTGSGGAPATAAGAPSTAGKEATSSARGGGAGEAGSSGASEQAAAGGEAGSDRTSGAGGEAGSDQTSGAGGEAGGASAAFHVTVERASDENPSSPGTIGIVTWTTDAAALTEAHVDFGLDTSYGFSAPVDLADPSHRTLLLGMKPSRTYHFRIAITDGTTRSESADYTLETGAVPAGLVPFKGFTVDAGEARDRGFITLSYWQGNGANVAFIIDADGDIVWWHTAAQAGVGRAAMSADGKNMWLVHTSNAGAPLERVSMDTLDAETYPNAIGSHDITPVTGETMAFIDYGEPDCDSVFEIDPSGATREIFESEGIIDPATCHGNALRYSAARDLYTFSDRFNDIFFLNRAGEIQERLSELVDGGHDEWGGSQHGHQLLDDSILIYANRGAGTSESAAIEYSLEGGEELRRLTTGHFSWQMGDVQRLPGDHTLVTFSNDSIIQEFDASGRVVLELDGGGSFFGYSLWRPSLYGPPPNL